VSEQLESVVIKQVLDVGYRPREEVVDTENLIARLKQVFAQVRAEKSCASRDENTTFEGHQDSTEF
jgi:hypothetical protein